MSGIATGNLNRGSHIASFTIITPYFNDMAMRKIRFIHQHGFMTPSTNHPTINSISKLSCVQLHRLTMIPERKAEWRRYCTRKKREALYAEIKDDEVARERELPSMGKGRPESVRNSSPSGEFYSDMINAVCERVVVSRNFVGCAQHQGQTIC
jgi:hypothetical protein